MATELKRIEAVTEAVERLARIHGDRLGEHLERIAYHAVRGERWDTALTYLQRAGTKMLDRSAYREAAATFVLGKMDMRFWLEQAESE